MLKRTIPSKINVTPKYQFPVSKQIKISSILYNWMLKRTIASKLNVTPKGVRLSENCS